MSPPKTMPVQPADPAPPGNALENRTNPVWAELVQLVPVVALALPFILTGEVDLARAGPGFFVAAALTIPITVVVYRHGYLSNPILVGASLWLWLGAAAFGFHWAAVVQWLAETQAFGLFLGALCVGTVYALVSPWGYVGFRSPHGGWVRRASLGLLALTVLSVVWAWFMRHDVRLGGGLPFILLNVVRRVLIARAPSGAGTGA